MVHLQLIINKLWQSCYPALKAQWPQRLEMNLDNGKFPPVLYILERSTRNMHKVHVGQVCDLLKHSGFLFGALS